jgi:hypothetical protein
MSQINELILSDTGQMIIGGAVPILAVVFLALLAQNRRTRF